MKRLATIGPLVLSLLLLQASGPSFAQQAAQKQPPSPSWKKKVEGVWTTKLGREEPELAILRLSEDEYKQFDQDPKGYLNNPAHHVFTQDVIRAVGRVDISQDEPYKKKEASKDDPCLVVVVHTSYSKYAIVSSCYKPR